MKTLRSLQTDYKWIIYSQLHSPAHYFASDWWPQRRQYSVLDSDDAPGAAPPRWVPVGSDRWAFVLSYCWWWWRPRCCHPHRRSCRRQRERGGNANGIKTQLRLIMSMMMMMVGIQMLFMFDVATNWRQTRTYALWGLFVSLSFGGWNPNKSFSLLTDSIWRAETFSVSGLTQFASKTLEKFHLVLFVFLFLYVVFVWAFSSVFSLVCCFFFGALSLPLFWQCNCNEARKVKINRL